MDVYTQMGDTTMIKPRFGFRSAILFALLATLVLATACGTSGSVSGSRQSCSSRGSEGECSGSFKKLSGTYSLDIENEHVVSEAEIQVKASVQTGPLKVYVRTPDDEINSVDVPVGGAATLLGTAKGEFDGFKVYFEAVEGQAEGVKYQIRYFVP
jgi:hypothetical protein